MSILFGNFDLLGNNYDFYGLYLVPFIKNEGSKDIRAIYMKQDIILGAGSDTIMDLGRLSLSLYNDRMNRFNLADPQDVFVAVGLLMLSQICTVWIFTIGILLSAEEDR